MSTPHTYTQPPLDHKKGGCAKNPSQRVFWIVVNTSDFSLQQVFGVVANSSHFSLNNVFGLVGWQSKCLVAGFWFGGLARLVF